jgi:hypothetical protein
VPQRFLRIREKRFTVTFREAITIAATFTVAFARRAIIRGRRTGGPVNAQEKSRPERRGRCGYRCDWK